MKSWIFPLLAALLAGCTTPQSIHQAQPPTQTIAYAADDANFPNPERGFSHPNQTPEQLRAGNMALTHVYFRLDKFKAAPLSPEFLASVQTHFDGVRRGGIKTVPRFIYNFPAGLPLKPGDEDAPLNVVLGHIDQLTPVIRDNSDVIAFLEAGFVGAWGEWHNSTSGLEATPAKAAILKALLRALPRDRFVALRYQRDKVDIFGRTAPVTAAEVFSGTDVGRVAHHNDCFLASADDWGTYRPTDPQAIEAQKDYLAAENLYVPQGGETCNIGKDAQPYVHCPTAISDLARLRWSQLNAEYHGDVLKLWRDEGCYDDIARRLGYRLRLISGDFPRVVAPGGSLNASLRIANDGFAAPYNRRDVELVLRQRGGETTAALPVPVEPRLWAGGAEHRVELRALVPAGLAPGDYDLLLNLPDAAPRLRGRPEYSIRLANRGSWEPETGYNRLLATVRVGAQAR